jgi:hypothetical protein
MLMLQEIFGLGLSLIVSAVHTVGHAPAYSDWPERIWLVAAATGKGVPPAFRLAERAVSNWRHETFWNVALSPSAAIGLAFGKTPDGVSRCVKLNNYWCIKRAGWTGEIASDAEGHVAFASALEGATVAALLLRRYYIDYNRRSALAIVSRWAPAQCGLTIAHPGALRVVRGTTNAALRDVAPRGIQNTLRARWLAGHGRGGFLKTRKAAPLRHSIVRSHLPAMMPAPEIAVGMGEREIKLKPLELTSLGLSGRLSPLLPALPAASCAADGARIEAYALHAIEGVVSSSNEDLHLFGDDGQPAPNLARVMRNMAAVEIGPLSVRGWLIDAGIAAVRLRSTAEKPQPAVPPRQP